ncbi:hypothetical protein ACVWY2_005977 [Bradyrhizobium sp. JR6.1]
MSILRTTIGDVGSGCRSELWASRSISPGQIGIGLPVEQGEAVVPDRKFMAEAGFRLAVHADDGAEAADGNRRDLNQVERAGDARNCGAADDGRERRGFGEPRRHARECLDLVGVEHAFLRRALDRQSPQRRAGAEADSGKPFQSELAERRVEGVAQHLGFAAEQVGVGDDVGAGEHQRHAARCANVGEMKILRGK